MHNEMIRSVEGEVDESKSLLFDQGLPGFESLKRFTLVDLEEVLPFKMLLSLEQEDISFLVGDPFFFYPEYEWQLPEAVQHELEITDESEIEIWTVITISTTLVEATVNLLAPIVINRIKGVGKQHILHNSDYQTRHPLVRPAGASGLAE